MPINPNIALGAQQQQQPINMLGQMGQLYALKAAKQEFEGGEALRDAFASGGDLNDPAFVQRLRAANPKMALDIEAKHLAGQKTRSELEAAAYKNTREALTMVNNPESLRAFSLSQFNDPVIGPRLKAIGLTPEIAIANLDKEIATSGFNTALKKAAMGLDRFFTDETSRRNQDVASGASYLNAQLNREKFNDERLRGRTIAGDNQFLREDIYGNLTPVGNYGTQFGPNAPAAAPVGGGGAPALPPAAANAFVTAKPPVNGLITQPNAAVPPVVQPGSPTRANAAAIEAQQNIPRPPARAGYKYDQATGNLVKIPDEKPVWNDKAQVWMTPPTAENPQGTVTEAPAVQKAVQERTANATLKVAGYNPKTQTNEISSLIKESTSGLAENWANKVWSAISGTGSKGAEAIAQLETRANEMTLALAPNGSLGAGFSNEDRTFMLGKLGDVANPDKPMNVRLAAWEDVMERTARTAGVPYTKQSFGSSKSSGGAKTISRTGTLNGRKVVEYSDGTTAYAD